MTTGNNSEIQLQLREQFARLPKVLQDIISSAAIGEQLKNLAKEHQLHLDQWGLLEEEVMLTLLGVEEAADLEKNISRELGVPSDIAKGLAQDISLIIFEPIREELERELEHPDAKAADVSGVEAARAQMLGDAAGALVPPAPRVLPATPPAAPPEGKIGRAPVSAAYRAGEPSTVRASVDDDPYREAPA